MTRQREGKGEEEGEDEGDDKGQVEFGTNAINPAHKPPQDRSPYEKMEMATKRLPVADKEKRWHTPTKDGRQRSAEGE